MTGQKYLTLENVCAGGSIIWGLFVGNPYVCSFAKNPRLYQPMSELTTNEVVWGLIYISLGTIALILSLKNLQKWAALLIGITYATLAMLFFMGDVESSGWGFFGFFGFSNFVHWWGYRWKSAKESNG